MPLSVASSCDRRAPAAPHDELLLCARVRAEFREMPGLNLTLSQAARLFGIEPARCERVLGALVDAGDLAGDGNAFTRPAVDRR